jgi:ABC-type dipeptide/oligopeptide/nickel transport system ATPase component
MYKPLIAIVGHSGSGKSTSLRNLDPKTTYILDLERKGFPFRNANRFNIIPVENANAFPRMLAQVLKEDNCEIVVVESFTKYVEQVNTLATNSFKGYDIWSFYNRTIRNMLDSIKNDKATIIFTAVDDIVKIPQITGGESSHRRVKVQGKVHEGAVEKEFLMVLFTEVRKNEKTDEMEYFFQTNTDGITSAKTPMGMFDEQLIPNDIVTVLKKMEEYYA